MPSFCFDTPRAYISKKTAPAILVLIACLLFAISRFAVLRDGLAFVDYDGYYSYFIARWGFDAQAIDPLMGLMGTGYRYQRIIYPLSVHIMSLGGSPALVPFFLVGVNIVSIAAGTYFCALILAELNTNPWYSVVYGFFGSQFLGLMTSLSEPMAFFLVVLGIYLWMRKQFAPFVATFAVASLTKETTLLFVFAFIGYYLLERKWIVAARIGLALVPFAAWQLVLFVWLGETGFSSRQPFELPLWGWLSGYFEMPGLFLLLAIVLAPMAYLPTLLLGFKAAGDFLRSRHLHPFLLMVLIHVAFILVLPKLTAAEPAAMVRIIQGLVLSALLYGSLICSRRILNYSVLWIATLAILLKGSVGAG